jgi:manganese transport protein
MEGFLQMKLKPWVRRLVTRGIAIVPALVVAAVMGQRAVGQLLLVSQVVLSLQLSFAVVPLVHFTSSQAHVGRHANGWFMTGLAILLALLIAGLNGYLLVMVFMGKSGA